MKTRLALLPLGASVLCFATLATAAPKKPEKPAPVPLSPTAPNPTEPTAVPLQPPAVIATTFGGMLNALQKNDYTAFVAQGNDAFKAAVTVKILKDVSDQLAPRMKEGFTSTYVTDLKQQGLPQYFWKLSFKDGSDEYLLSITMRDDKVEGFLIR